MARQASDPQIDVDPVIAPFSSYGQDNLLNVRRLVSRSSLRLGLPLLLLLTLLPRLLLLIFLCVLVKEGIVDLCKGFAVAYSSRDSASSSGFIYVTKTLDDGATWDTPVRASGGSGFTQDPDTEPSMVITGNNIYIAYKTRRLNSGESDSDIGFVKNALLGASGEWSNAIAVNPGANGGGSDNSPRLVLSGSTLVVAYTTGSSSESVFIVRSTDNGDTWSAAVVKELSGATFDSAINPTLAVNGNTLVVRLHVGIYSINEFFLIRAACIRVVAGLHARELALLDQEHRCRRHVDGWRCLGLRHGPIARRWLRQRTLDRRIQQRRLRP